MIRLDKFLAEMDVGSRSQVKQYLKKGMVCVNDTVITRPEQKIDENRDTVTFQGNVISYKKYEYYMFHKPAGCVTAREDSLHRTVMDYLPELTRKDLSPVGRLDLDTEGLLLITNDGNLNHRLLSPAHHVEKTYFAKVEGCVTEEHIAKFREGLDIGDEKLTAPAHLVIEHSGEISRIRLTITEGRFHQVKRMFEAVGCRVLYLKRLSMGGVILDDTLLPGQFRPLTDEEYRCLCQAEKGS